MDSTKHHQTSDAATEGISSEAAVEALGNRYDLVLVGARRARELSRGDPAKVETRRGAVVTALKEIEQKKIGREYLAKEPDLAPRRRRRDRDYG